MSEAAGRRRGRSDVPGRRDRRGRPRAVPHRRRLGERQKRAVRPQVGAGCPLLRRCRRCGLSRGTAPRQTSRGTPRPACPAGTFGAFPRADRTGPGPLPGSQSGRAHASRVARTRVRETMALQPHPRRLTDIRFSAFRRATAQRGAADGTVTLDDATGVAFARTAAVLRISPRSPSCGRSSTRLSAGATPPGPAKGGSTAAPRRWAS